jgi:hypothetical protein
MRCPGQASQSFCSGNTRHLKDKGNGAVVFTDAITGETVTLQNSEVKKIKHSEFEQAVSNK